MTKENKTLYKAHQDTGYNCVDSYERAEICQEIKNYGYDVPEDFLDNDFENYLCIVISSSIGIDAYYYHQEVGGKVQLVSKEEFLNIFIDKPQYTIYGEKVN